MKAMCKLPKDVQERMDREIKLRIAEAQKELDDKVEEIRREERVYTLRRFLKASCYVLGEDGVGKKKKKFSPDECMDFIESFRQFFDENADTEYLWEHLDRVVMDQMGLFVGWERDYTDE